MMCSECGVPMVSRYAWDRGDRPEGHSLHAGRGLCRADYVIAYRAGEIEKHGSKVRSRRSRQEVLEDYMMIRDEVSSIAHAADRMGMTERALEKALERARKQGVTEARTPHQRRGTVYNQHTRRSA